jgi:hypothetical protein
VTLASTPALVAAPVKAISRRPVQNAFEAGRCTLPATATPASFTDIGIVAVGTMRSCREEIKILCRRAFDRLKRDRGAESALQKAPVRVAPN